MAEVVKKHCYDCNGTGWQEKLVPCDRCNQSGMVKPFFGGSTEVCGKCHGDGNYVTEIECSSCNNRGYYESIEY